MRVVWAGIAMALFVALAFVARHALTRAYIAYRIHRAHVLTPTTEVGWWSEARFFWDVAGLRLQRDERARRFEPQVKPLAKEISKRQEHGKNVALSTQIYREVRWWINFTADDARTATRIADLAASLDGNRDQSVAQQQSAEDGSWGAGYTVWFMKLYGSVNDSLARGAVPQHPLRFLDGINSAQALTTHLNGLLRDDFTVTRMINRQELDETVSALARLLYGEVKADYAFDAQVKPAFKRFLDDWQNPETGCWGVWFVGRDGVVWRQDDVGITFHIVSDLDGQVQHLDRIVRRVLELRTIDFPAGIRMKGRYENHLNWDVVKIFRYAWPSLDEATRRAAVAELARMLQWCLAESYQRDGSFKVSELDDTAGDAMHYGVRFLCDVGFFRKKERFWTDQDFPEAKAIHAQLKSHLEGISSRGAEFEGAYKKLGNQVD